MPNKKMRTIKDPLKILVKSPKQIEEMREKGLLFRRKYPRYKYIPIVRLWAVKIGNIIVHHYFPTRNELEIWADFNYKSSNNREVVQLNPMTQKILTLKTKTFPVLAPKINNLNP